MKPLSRSLVLIAALCAAGCTSGLLQSHAPPSQLYVLRAAPPVAPAVPAASGGLRVLRPLPAPGLDRDRLALSRSDNRLDYYAVGRWGAPLPDVVSDLAVNVLRQSGAWATVTDSRASVNAGYQLQLYIDHFEMVYAPGSDPASAASVPMATVGLHGVLIRRSDAKVVANLSGASSEQAGSNRMGAVVLAFQAAANAALAQVAAQAATVR